MKEILQYAQGCPMKSAWMAIDGKWKIPAIYLLCECGTMRYGELKKALGISGVMLSSTLKELEASGLVIRTQYNEIPPRVDYSLSALALQLSPILEQLAAWGALLERAEIQSNE